MGRGRVGRRGEGREGEGGISLWLTICTLNVDGWSNLFDCFRYLDDFETFMYQSGGVGRVGLDIWSTCLTSFRYSDCLVWDLYVTIIGGKGVWGGVFLWPASRTLFLSVRWRSFNLIYFLCYQAFTVVLEPDTRESGKRSPKNKKTGEELQYPFTRLF